MRAKLRTVINLLTLLASLSLVTGCERKEKVVDIETPAGSVEVERNKDTGKVDVEVQTKKKEANDKAGDKVDIDVNPGD